MAKGGGCGCSLRGGFYPSVMHGIATTGPYFMTAAVGQGIRLVRNETGRMKGRKMGRRKGSRKAGSRKANVGRKTRKR